MLRPPPEIIVASKRGEVSRIQELIKSDTALLMEAQGDLNQWPLLEAAQAGQVEVVRLLLDAGASVHQRDGFRRTALHRASVAGHADVASLLLERGADPRAKNIEGFTALMGAAHAGRDAAVRLLLRHGGSQVSYIHYTHIA